MSNLQRHLDRSLDMARNLFGRLDEDLRIRLIAVVENPSQETWDDAYSIIVGSDGWMTLWQAILAIYPTFPRSKPLEMPWPEIPTQEMLIQAIDYATH